MKQTTAIIIVSSVAIVSIITSVYALISLDRFQKKIENFSLGNELGKIFK